MTVPKAGTTWTQEVVWTMRKNPNLDNPTSSLPLHVRSPYLEGDILAEGLSVEEKGGFAEVTKQQGKDPNKGVFLNIARVAERPRIFKTHLSFSFISDTALSKAKIVYTIRDPRDLCLSYHHHMRLFKNEGYTGSLDQYVDAFLEDSATRQEPVDFMDEVYP
ncbi:luciferin sulfotransferase-like [Hyalella azteca]|uniref:Luciferin sulfotransferase-like n=1 Tax=Hyalella azteca TaxID=294128 RepID=A0A8B7N5Q4_HYAAZ|nr:luciferin sulfotransferase-like [Hyalella azteca]